jgi:hypothetical protein
MAEATAVAKPGAWGDPPLWTVTLPSGEQVDVHAVDEAEAISKVEQDAAAAAAATDVEEQIKAALLARLANLTAARDAMTGASPTLFQGLTAQERGLLRMLVQDDIGLIRLLLRRLDAAE